MSAADRAPHDGRSLMIRGLVLLCAHLLIVTSLGAKLLYDRATRPRIWVEAAPYDPDLPIRGRYVRLRLKVGTVDVAPALNETDRWESRPVTLEVQGDHLVARRIPGEPWQVPASVHVQPGDGSTANIAEPVAYFIPEHAPDPSRQPAGVTLWVECTIPRAGPPRPIRLGVRGADGLITPLELR